MVFSLLGFMAAQMFHLKRMFAGAALTIATGFNLNNAGFLQLQFTRIY